MLHGREAELGAVEQLLADARAGRSRALVLRGEAGIGKSAILERAHELAGGMRVLCGTGIETESALPFAGLHLLLRGLTDRVRELPEPQAAALCSALSLTPIPRNDRYLVGAAVLTLFAELAEERPLLCLVDDAHWLDQDSAEALLFVARRLEAEQVALLFSARDLDGPPFPAQGLAELRMAPLSSAAADGLLDDSASDLPKHVRVQIVAAAQGNPLALHEFPAAQRAGRLSAQPNGVTPLPIHSRIQQAFADRISDLPAATRTLLLLTAADSTGEPDVVLRAATNLGAGLADLAPAERNEIVRYVDGRLDFRHPLIRSAVYQAASSHERITVHTELATAFGELGNPCQRAWHLAAAATGPDEAVARALVEAAEADRAFGGYSAVTAAYERAAALSPDPEARGSRLLAAAYAAYEAGESDRVMALVDEAQSYLRDPTLRAECVALRATLVDELNRPLEAHQILLDAGIAIAEHNKETASWMLFYAVETAWMAGDFDVAADVARRAEELELPDGGREVRWLSAAAVGLNAAEPAELAEGVSALRELIDNAVGPDIPSGITVSWWQLMLGDHRTAYEWALAAERECREQGAVGSLLPALGILTRTQLHLGQRHNAVAGATEGLRIARDIGREQAGTYLSTVLAFAAAQEGAEQRCIELVDAARKPGVGHSYVRAGCALGLLEVGLGRYEAVFDRLAELVEGPNRMDALSAVPDLVEAAARLNQQDCVRVPAARYIRWAELVEQPWARGVGERCAALLGSDDEAEERYIAAVLAGREPGGRPFELARTELLYGEWLRRQRRRVDARPVLRSAADAFERLGASPWLARAQSELRATGETLVAKESAPDLLSRLTPQELQVVRLAADGLSNRDIGAQLFLSPRTVGHHLYKAYPKLGVTSRNELARIELAS
ncbi:putative ATPase [Tamaricihabitans halophyticus]|uniref:Putative ATPase n=1 Tax=Tamaricihabitans halophyticus TaxID=1262583 RepID=A0A4V2SV46_9PSEU|nr:helix-turn-helix transcriptional regulator [Tamaricihabitans halophyticus]TCP57046.1 putative ATPase [Tamaricihabitans halophyticus]